MKSGNETYGNAVCRFWRATHNKAIEVVNMFRTKNKAWIAARVLEIFIGLYFIAGAIPKVLDIDKFVVQMAAYKVIEAPSLLEPAALFNIFAELCLGMFLFLGIRLKGLTILGLQCIIIVFTILITYAWIFHDLQDCGCFPVIKMSPPVSIIKNILTLAAGIYILWTLEVKPFLRAREPKSAPDSEPSPSTLTWALALTMTARILVSVLLSAGCIVYAWRHLDREALAQEDSQEKTLFGQFELFMNEGYFNLAEGLYLVPVMSSSCPECKEKVPELNDLFLTPDLPSMVALCYEEQPGELDTFKSLTNPLFPTYSLGDRALLYFRLIDKEPFRLVLVQDGKIAASWDGYVPPLEEIMEYIIHLEELS